METDRDCRRIVQKLAAYQDGELSKDERNRMSMHLQNCPSCRSVYAEMERVSRSLEEIRDVEPPHGFYQRLLVKINAPVKHRFDSLFQWFSLLFPFPAATFALSLIGLLLGGFLGNTIVTGELWSVKNQAIYTQAQWDINALQIFSPVPPGTLGDGYLRMVSPMEDRER